MDVPQGKNLLGAFYHPRAIYMDLDLLSTLDGRNYRAGLVELVKMAFMDPPLLQYYLEQEEVVLARGGAAYNAVMEELLRRNCEFKNRVVQQDDRESNLRKVLNYGHTFGHAVELLSHFACIHGEAVAIGIRFAAFLAGRMGLLAKEDIELQNQVLDRLQMPSSVPEGFAEDDVLRVMAMDKKAKEGNAEFILLDGIGKVHTTADGGYAIPVPVPFLREAIRQFLMETKN